MAACGRVWLLAGQLGHLSRSLRSGRASDTQCNSALEQLQLFPEAKLQRQEGSVPPAWRPDPDPTPWILTGGGGILQPGREENETRTR